MTPTIRQSTIIAALLLVTAPPAAAEPEEPGAASQPAPPRVIQVRDGEIYVNVPAEAARGQLLEVYRDETVVDPATGDRLTGRLRICRLRLLRGGDRFSVARAPQGAVVKVGDVVALTAPVAPPAPAIPARGAATLVRRPAPPPLVHRRAEDLQRERLLDANLGATNRLVAGGGYVSYGGKDHFSLFEGEYTHYFFHSVVHSIRFGGGGLVGETYFDRYDPSSDGTDRSLEPVRFYYGLAGVDFTLTEWLGVEMEAIFGVTVDGVGGGALSAFRVGKRDGVNVRVGGWLRSYVGHEGFLALEIPVGPRFRLTPSVVIDNMPRGEDMGFRALLKGELRIGRYLGLTAEVGGAARDANTGGFVGTGGLSVHM